jgi:anti-sigma B factor antagonist
MSQGKLDVEEKGEVSIATFKDVVMMDEGTMKLLGDDLDKLASKEKAMLIINFEHVDYISSAVLGRMVKVYKMVRKGKGKVKLCGLKKNPLQVFKITRLDKMFEIYNDTEKAVGSFKGLRLFK